MKLSLLFLIFLFVAINLSAQSDSAKVNPAISSFNHGDSLYLARLNTSGNLMIAGGIALCATGSYSIYEGVQVYNAQPSATSTNPAADINRNHQQGTIFLAAGGIAIAGGIILAAIGIKNKIDFKQRLKYMSLQTGILTDGALGVALGFR